ncbi:kinase-like domain-containing protein [Cristinia sonorae]|uniref:Kinase-like domain-containing protein n=1 Tax=Cristinia sonorae TaxID=1940300 RepID=A0A8K0XS01_9AGAR|nr:kinase-like domain-containing protein [Cristinia sonorae]
MFGSKLKALTGASRKPSIPRSSTPVDKGLIDIEKAVERAVFEQEEAPVFSLSHADAQAALDYVWMLMGFPAVPNVPEKFQTHDAKSALRALALKLALRYDMFPAATVIKGVLCTETEGRGVGGFADVFFGSVNYMHVALKRLRQYGNASEKQRLETRKSFYRESILWKHLSHPNVLPFLGVADDVFKNTICMVLPWMHHGSIRNYIPELKQQGKLLGPDFVEAIDKWLHQTAMGLAYLHQEGIAHGDLHAGNILIDTDGNVRLTDFGMALIAEASASNSSSHGGGAIRWRAPELIDPDEFGLDSTRPTFASDVYSFGITCVELYTGDIPFAGTGDVVVMRRVLRGMRPARPSLPSSPEMTDRIWQITNRCWDQDFAKRPHIGEVCGWLAEAISPVEVAEERPVDPEPHIPTPTPDLVGPPIHSPSPAPPDSFDELMRETPESPADKASFFRKAIAEGERQLKLGGEM